MTDDDIDIAGYIRDEAESRRKDDLGAAAMTCDCYERRVWCRVYGWEKPGAVKFSPVGFQGLAVRCPECMWHDGQHSSDCSRQGRQS